MAIPSTTNVTFVPSIFLKLVLANMGGNMFVTRNMSSDYSKQFGNKSAQVGDTVNVVKPPRFIGVDDNLNYTHEDATQQKTPISVSNTTSVYFDFDSWEETLRLETVNGWAKSAAITMATKINARAAQFCALNTANTVGTPGVVPNAMSTFLGAGDKLYKQGLPTLEGNNLNLIINRSMSSALVDAQKLFFNNQDIVGKQQKYGRVEDQLGYNILLDETLYAHTTGLQGGTPANYAVNGANQTSLDGDNGTGTLIIDGLPNSSTIAKAGDVFTLGTLAASPVMSIHAQSRLATGELKQFTLTADLVSNGSGQATAAFFPAITPANGTNQYANVSAAPADNSLVQFWGGAADANKVSKQGLLLHKDAFAFITVPMAMPSKGGSIEIAAQETDPETGLTFSIIREFDFDTRKWKTRLDAMFGFGVLYRELACRIASGY